MTTNNEQHHVESEPRKSQLQDPGERQEALNNDDVGHGATIDPESLSSSSASSTIGVADTDGAKGGYEPNGTITAVASNSSSRDVKAFVYAVAATAALGAVVFGYSLTGAGGTFVMPGFQQHFGWTCPDDEAAAEGDDNCVPMTEAMVNTSKSLITALQSVGSIVGALFNPFVIDRIGRRWTIFFAALVYSVGAAVQCSAPVLAALYLGRWVGGAGVGMMAMSIPLYIAECAPTHRRGTLVTFWQVGVTVGMLLGTGVNVGADDVMWGWRVSYGGNIVFAILLMIAMATYMPESPRFLAGKAGQVGERNNNDDDGVTSAEVVASSAKPVRHQPELERTIRRLRHDHDMQHSLDAIYAELEEERKLGTASWSDIFLDRTGTVRKRVLLGMSMQFLNQLSGNESINFYAPSILSNVFGPSASLLNSFLLGVVNFVAVLVALRTVDSVGRVPLWTLGGVTMLIAMVAISVLQSLEPTAAVNNAFLSMLAVFTFAYHGTMGPLAWDICAEMFPIRVRGKAVGLTTMSNFVGVVIVGAVFPFFQSASPPGTFAFFSVMLFLNIVLVYFFLPETAEKSPLQIEDEFKSHRPKLFRNVFYLSAHH